MKQCDLTKGLVVFLTIMFTLFCGVMSSSWAGSDFCDDQEFDGCYGFSHSGIMLMQNVDNNGPVFDNKGNPVITEAPMSSVGVFCLDVDGNLTGREIVRYGTITFPATISGEYEVCSDCTGTAWICAIPDGSPSGIESTISFVVTTEREELQMVTTDMVPCVSPVLSVSASSTPPAPIIEPINIVGIAKKQ